MLITALLLLVLLPISIVAKCPSRAESWCLQVDGFDSIVLDGSRFRDIGKVFRKIEFLFDDSGDAKDLDQLLLINNHALRSLEPNAFCDFRFRRIVIKNCTHLSRIHPDAFNGTTEYLRVLILDRVGLSGLQSENTFEALNSLTKLEELELKNHQILKIRPYSFRQPELKRLLVDGPLELIENNAFYYLDSIRILHLTKSIRYIQQHAFDLKVANNKTLDIYLEAKLSTIEPGAFTYTQRPVTINLYLNKLRNFDYAVFRPVLMASIRHELILHGNPKDMHDRCQLAWLFHNQHRGVFTFKDEPLLNVNEVNNWHCSEAMIHLDDDGIDIIDANQAGIDAKHNIAPAATAIAAVQLLYLLILPIVFF